jgi:hypothetical protein
MESVTTPPPLPAPLRPPPLVRQTRRRGSFQSYPPIFRGTFLDRLNAAASPAEELGQMLERKIH